MTKTLRALFEKYPVAMGALTLPLLPLVVVVVIVYMGASLWSMLCRCLLEDIDEWWGAGE